MKFPQAHRRQILGSTAAAFAGFVASGAGAKPANTNRSAWPAPAKSGGKPAPKSNLVPDPEGLLDLQEGFSYRIVSQLGDAMDDGLTVPDAADGMGSFALPNGDIALVRNHELTPNKDGGGTLLGGYARRADGTVLPGGTTTIVLDAKTLAVKRQFRSLAGTMRNCSGGITPWGTWLTCEEPGYMDRAPDHGFVFEVPAGATSMVEAKPLKAMGRFNHEAACVDPATGVVYMSEDNGEGLLYRFVPKVPGDLAKGGQLQALALTSGIRDSRNSQETTLRRGVQYTARWIDLDNPEAPSDDLRKRGAAEGALVIARGEGLHMGLEGGANNPVGEFYLCSTSGGAAGLGQIFRIRIGAVDGADTIELFFESENKEQLNFGDNLCVSPFGDLIVCEDQYTDVVNNRLIGITPEGLPYVFGALNRQTEFAGGCFAPDGKTFFVNAYSPAKTIAITGPWETLAQRA